jgi:hypothetical protein
MPMMTFAGEDDDEDANPDDEPPSPSCMDYIMHFLTLFWKILFAFIPPTGEFITWKCKKELLKWFEN